MDWFTDMELFSLMKQELFPAVVGDVLDEMGYRHQFLSQSLRPLHPDMVIVGRAMPVLEADYPATMTMGSHGPLSGKDFGLMFEALDGLKAGEVYIAAGASPKYALWGGLMTSRAKHLKAAGAILNGYCRDTREILSMDFPVFSYGSYAQDQKVRGKVLDYRVSIEVDHVVIHPGDLIFSDRDGVLLIPKSIERDVIHLALEKARTENRVRNAIDQGMATVEAYQCFGVM
ncbi:MAG: RraA family protein [Aquitalea sp.]|nr:RraA family protein [Aquitalea sp.]